MADARSSGLTPQFLIGLIVIGLGVVFILENLGIARWDQYIFRYWPVALIAIGLLKLWQSRDGMGGAFGGLLFTAGGTWLLLEQTTLVRVSFKDLWPLILVCFGAYLVWQGVAGPRRRSTAQTPASSSTSSMGGSNEAGAPADANATINAVALLGGIECASNSRAFKGGDATAVLGGCELDLRHASIEGEAVLDIFALWGGIEIRVPEDWTIVSRVVPVLGGFADSTRPAQAALTKRLVVRGLVMMAGVEVKN
jgi:hypothetical protein